MCGYLIIILVFVILFGSIVFRNVCTTISDVNMELTQKKRARAPHRSVTTRKITEVEAMLAAIKAGGEPDLAKLAGIRTVLKDKLDLLRTLDKEIEDLTEDDTALDTEVQQAEDIVEAIYTALAGIDQVLKPSEAPPPAVTTPPSTPAAPIPSVGATHTTTAPAVTSTGNKTRLPKLTIRPFNGDTTKWRSFWDAYNAAIHRNDSLSKIEKFTYLIGIVEQSAEEAIRGLSLTDANYDEAITILEKRFGNKQQAISKHMDALMNLEVVTSADDVTTLRCLYDGVESHLRGLKGLGVASDSYGTLLSSILFNKLPRELCLIISRGVSEDEWSLNKLMEAFEEELKARERALTPLKNPSHRKRGNSTPLPPTASTLHTSSQPVTCCYCQKTHAPERCKIVKRFDARRKILRDGGRCFSCLKRGHIGGSCRSGSV